MDACIGFKHGYPNNYDLFAIITYIVDYYMKDDSGTMEFLKAAIKDSVNQPLRDRLKFLINISLIHR